MAWLMDQEIRKLILEAEQRTIQILTDKRHVLDALAKALLREEILDREQVKRIIEQVQPTLPALRGSHLPDLPDNKK
jgi:ATP-dependent Zn protease